MHVIVVDDGSPVRARDDLAGLDPAQAARVTLIEQPDASPGAARNRALAAMGPSIRHVCFLDSDDEWVEDHVARALTADTFDLSPSQRDWSLAWRRQVASDLVRTLAHLLRHRRPVNWRSVRDFARRRPLLWLAPPGTWLRPPRHDSQPSDSENSSRIASQD